MNESNTPIASIGYSGEVTIKVVEKNKILKTFKIHNTGYPRLWQTLTTFLANGESQPFPQYLDIQKEDNNNSTKSILNTLKRTNNTYNIINGISYTIITANINYYDLLAASNEGLKIEGTLILKLFPSNIISITPNPSDSNLMMSMTWDLSGLTPDLSLPPDSPSNQPILIYPGQSILIDWRIRFDNLPQQSSESSNLGV